MSNIDYIIMPFHGMFNHTAGTPMVTNDVDETNTELDVHVRSGDYLSTVATKLDDLSQKLPQVCLQEVAALQKLINDLLYIQRNYRLIRK